MIKNIQTLRKFTLLIAGSLTVMSGATIAPSLPQIAEVFSHIPHAELLTKLVLTMPALLIVIFAPISGIIIDKLGRKKLLIFSLILYGIAGTSGLYANSMLGLLIGRAFLGIAVAGIMTTITTLITDYFAGDERNKFMGTQAAFMAFGGVVFVLTGGILAEINWRAPFYLYFASFIILPIAVYFLYEPKKEKHEIHLNDPNFSKLPIIAVYAIAFIGMGIFYMIPLQMPFLLKEAVGASNFKIGLAISTSALAGAIISLNFKRFKDKLRHRQIYVINFLLIAIGFISISFSKTYIMFLFSLILTGLGFGLFMPNTSLFLISIAPAKFRGRLIGGLTTTFFLGQFTSPIIVEPIKNMLDLSATFGIAGIFLILLSIGFFISCFKTS